MKPLSQTRIHRVFRHVQPLRALPQKKSLLTISPHAPLASVLPFGQLTDEWGSLLRFTAQLGLNSTTLPYSIQFA
jgi:hypothetical protein